MNKDSLILRQWGSKYRKSIKIKIGIALVLFTLLTTCIAFASYSSNINKGLADNLIRLHVIANSDSDADQALKRDVRDIILEYMKTQLKNSKDIEQTKFIINKDMKEIESIAKAEITRQGRNYPVKVMLGVYPFPTKAYGDITLPAGSYEALRVVIGDGEGANWWCVLFPPLCFVDATHGTVPDSVKQTLKDSLSKEEYNIITSADGNDDVPVKVKFKIVEIFQKSKTKIAGVFSWLFG